MRNDANRKRIYIVLLVMVMVEFVEKKSAAFKLFQHDRRSFFNALLRSPVTSVLVGKNIKTIG
jgi:hypothetical protein